jgi:sugar phosphate isomerase/epimerase
MHLSMHNWMRAEPIEVTVRRLAKYGYESIEISGEPESTTPKSSQVLKDNNIRCWGSVTLMLGERNLVAKDEEREPIGAVRQGLHHHGQGAGWLRNDHRAGHRRQDRPDGTPEEEWEWAVDSMKEIYDFAKKAGVKLAVEPINRFETYFCSRAAQAIALAEATGPDCGVCLDAFHLNIEEADPYRIHPLGKRPWLTSTWPIPTASPAGRATGTGPSWSTPSRRSATMAR